MEKLRKGMLIRRKASSAVIPIGPWMLVRSIGTDHKVCAERVDSDYIMRRTNDFSTLPRENVYVPTRAALIVSPCVITDIVCGKQWAVHNPATKKWLNVFNNSPEIITFYSNNGNKVIITVDEVRFYTIGREKMVKVYIKDIITKCIWS